MPAFTLNGSNRSYLRMRLNFDNGERASEKLSERLLGVLARKLGDGPATDDGNGELLWREFLVQSVSDLRRCIDALATLDALDTARCHARRSA